MSIVVLVVPIWIRFIVSKMSIVFFAFAWVYVEENPYRYNHIEEYIIRQRIDAWVYCVASAQDPMLFRFAGVCMGGRWRKNGNGYWQTF